MAGGGLIALVGYYVNHRDKIRYSALEVKDQILAIEDQIRMLNYDERDLRNEKLYKLTAIIDGNKWDLHKSKIGKYFTYEERQLINEFYLNAERIEQCRLDLLNCLRKTWEAKCSTEMLLLYYLKEERLSNDFNTLVNKILDSKDSFVPEICISIICEYRYSCKLIGTTTFSKIDKLINYHGYFLNHIF